jgi:hypothetical protein
VVEAEEAAAGAVVVVRVAAVAVRVAAAVVRVAAAVGSAGVAGVGAPVQELPLVVAKPRAPAVAWVREEEAGTAAA